MLIDFFLHLKARKLPVSTREFLTLLEALRARVGGNSIDDFYFLSRTARVDDRLCDREIRKGDTVILPVYALHRHHAIWDDPDQFRPARFLGQRPDRNRVVKLPRR